MNINPNIFYIIYWNDFQLIKLLIVLLLVISSRFLFKLLTKDLLPNGYEMLDFKIKNKIYNWICVFIYIGIFIMGIIILRIYRKDFLLDLKPLYKYFKFLYINHEYLLISIIFLSFICYLLLLVTVLKYSKAFLELRLLRQHIVLRYPKEGYFAWTMPPYHRDVKSCLYREIIYWFQKVHHPTLKGKIIDMLLPIGVYLEKRSYTKLVKIKIKITSFIINCFNIKYNIILLPILVLYDCYYNDFVITILFKFLPYYFLYTLWYKLSLFWYSKNVYVTDEILYELYYCKPNIEYFNLDEDDLMRLGLYTRFGLEIPEDLKGVPEYYSEGTGWHALRIMHYSRYELVDKTKRLYYNKHTSDIIQVRDDSANNNQVKEHNDDN
jgi:hypothetical protein